MNRNLSGWRRQAYDERDFKFVPNRRLAMKLAPTDDLSPNMGVQLNQDQLGTCGPNSADEVIQYDQKSQSLPVVAASRLFIYYVTRVLMGTVGQDSGVDNRTMLKGLNQFGFCPETMWPYNEDQYNAKPPQSAYTAALPNAIENYAAVNLDLTSYKTAISSGHVILHGFDVFQQIQSDQAAANGILTDPTGSSIGGHDVTVCGYSDVQLPGVMPGNVWPAGYFKFRNHWMNSPTLPWGDGGYGYISYAYATGKNSSDPWLINAVAGNIVTPTPIPPGPVTPTPSPSGLTLSSVLTAIMVEATRLVGINRGRVGQISQIVSLTASDMITMLRATFPGQ